MLQFLPPWWTFFINIKADLDANRDSKNFYDTPTSVYKCLWKDRQMIHRMTTSDNEW